MPLGQRGPVSAPRLSHSIQCLSVRRPEEAAGPGASKGRREAAASVGVSWEGLGRLQELPLSWESERLWEGCDRPGWFRVALPSAGRSQESSPIEWLWLGQEGRM